MKFYLKAQIFYSTKCCLGDNQPVTVGFSDAAGVILTEFRNHQFCAKNCAESNPFEGIRIKGCFRNWKPLHSECR